MREFSMYFYNSTSVVDVLTMLIALYGAGLSTYVIVQQRRDRRPNVRVLMRMAIVPDKTPSGGDTTTYFSVEAINMAQVPVALNMVGIIFPNDKIFVTTKPRCGGIFPHRLEPGTSYGTLVHIHEVLQRLVQEGFADNVEVLPLYRDQTSRDWKGMPMTVRINDWIARPDMW